MLRLAMGLCLASALLGAGRETVLIDTDSGLFGDDGAALVMLMRSPSLVNVAGVTVVSGNVWAPQGAEYMLHILDLLKKPLIQVYTGAASPLVHNSAMVLEAARRWGRQEFIGAFGDDPAEVKPAPGSKLNARKAHHEGAVEFLISQIERHPGEITILAIGPMTNIALALKLHPEIETKIKRIVFMGGNVQVTGNASAAAEFNFWFDPEAARMVLRSRIPQKVMFSLDICNTAPLRKPEFDLIAAAHTPITELFKEDLGNRYPAFLKRPAAVGYMWDSLAAAFLIDPGFVTRAEVRYVDVLAVWGRFYGSTVPLDRRTAPDATPVTLITEIDLRRVFTRYKDLLTRPE